jgi:hypothetical protein
MVGLRALVQLSGAVVLPLTTNAISLCSSVVIDMDKPIETVRRLVGLKVQRCFESFGRVPFMDTETDDLIQGIEVNRPLKLQQRRLLIKKNESNCDKEH